MTNFPKFNIVLTGLLVVLFIGCNGQEEQPITIVVENIDSLPLSVPVSLDIGLNMKNDITLFKINNSEAEEIPFQIADNKLWFLSRGGNDSGKYLIKKGKSEKEDQAFVFTQEDGNFQFSNKNKPLLTYRYGMTYPPEGVDSVFRKSGYIHPIITPKGDTLTRIQPLDHYHHYGMWGPWTHTQIKEQQVDFWNLGDRKGTVLFKKFNDMSSGTVFALFNAEQEHIDFITEKEPQIALNENLDVTLWDLNHPYRYMFDYKSTFNSPLENGILFEAYRYGGGIGMRFTERWKADNCSVLTSEGKDRLTADGTNARWCIVSGASADGKGSNGILFMSHPENRSHPEPMRVWPIDANEGRGDMFFEFCPIRHEEWKIEPNEDYLLNYRMVVFDGELLAEEAEAYWQAFAKQPEAQVISK